LIESAAGLYVKPVEQQAQHVYYLSAVGQGIGGRHGDISRFCLI
jgi:hypothetical protein